MTRDYSLFVKDILKAIENIDEFRDGMSFEEFCGNEKTKSAVVWQIQVIGEAAKNLPEAIREKYKEVPWKYMARIRDKIAHFYFGIDYEIVWNVIIKNLPEIKPLIEKILREMKADRE
ncbi:MAG TPA: DUF86 domain-containing protein [bacterium]|nr:DUF86 domain-containing protein [bacterium]